MKSIRQIITDPCALSGERHASAPRGEQSTQSGVSPPPSIRIHLFRGLKTDTAGCVATFDSRVELRKHLTETETFPSKEACPMFAAGIFDGPIAGRTPIEFTLVVGEHDAGTVSVDEAIARLEKAGIAAYLYTSARHTPEHPRWRVVAPPRKQCGAEDYRGLLDLLNGALGGCLAPESADLKRRWYYGRVAGAVEYRFEVAKGRKLIDDLAADDHGIEPIAVKPPKPPKESAPAVEREPVTEQDIDRAISALRAIPNLGKPEMGYERWLPLAMALHAATGGHPRALNALIEWTNDGQDEKTTAIWKGFTIREDGIGPGTLYQAAHDAGWVDPSRAPSIEGFEVLVQIGDEVVSAGEAERQISNALWERRHDDLLASAFAQLPADAQERVYDVLDGLDLAYEDAVVEEARAWLDRANGGAMVADADASSGARAPVAVLSLTLTRNKKTGYAEGTYENVYAACADPKLIGIAIGYDEFRDEIVVSADGGRNWRAMADEDYVTIHRLLERARFKRVAHETLRRAVNGVAKQVRRFDTAKLWLDRLQWDGVPRIERSLSTYLGAEDSDYTRAVGRYLWTAMAGRVLDPGCQADMVPVLVGGQGARKTSTVRAMVPAPEHFTEIDLSKRDNDLSRTMRGLLVGELGELRGLATRDLEAVKTWVTQRWESWVPKYLEFAVKFPRRCVFIGTTNETEFLADSTGERRWLPVQVDNCDPDAVAADREQLWAEAAAVWRASGIAWQDAERLARAEHAKYKVHDAWGDSIAAWLDGCEGFNEQKRREQPFTTGQVMAGALGIAAAQQRVSDQKRVGKILQSMGFKRDEHQHRVDGQKLRLWRPA